MRSSLLYPRDSLTDLFLLVTLDLPASTIIRYRFLGKVNGVVVFESDISEVETPEAGSGPFTESDTALYGSVLALGICLTPLILLESFMRQLICTT